MKTIVASFILVLTFSLYGVPVSQAMDAQEYVKTAKKTIKKVKRKRVRDIDELIRQQKALVRLGIEGCLEFAEKSPANAKMMHLVVVNSLTMQNMSLPELESQWHQGGYLRTHGIDISQFSQADIQLSYVDTVVRPATAIVALKAFEKSEEPELLERVYDELTEAVSHAEKLR